MSLESSIQEMSENPKLLHSVKALDTPIFSVEKELFSIEENKEIERWSVRHPGAVVILPLTASNEVLMAKQFRFPMQEYILEFPAGCLEEGESPLNCAKRELSEELKVQAENWECLGETFASPGFTDEILHFFLAKDLSEFYLPEDEDEEIEVVTLSVKQLKEHLLEGKIRDCKSHAIFSQAMLKGLI
jgi:ADP-ribose pyrophosphatase